MKASEYFDQEFKTSYTHTRTELSDKIKEVLKGYAELKLNEVAKEYYDKSYNAIIEGGTLPKVSDIIINIKKEL